MSTIGTLNLYSVFVPVNLLPLDPVPVWTPLDWCVMFIIKNKTAFFGTLDTDDTVCYYMEVVRGAVQTSVNAVVWSFAATRKSACTTNTWTTPVDLSRDSSTTTIALEKRQEFAF